MLISKFLSQKEQDQLNHLKGEIYRLASSVQKTEDFSEIPKKLRPYLPLLVKLRAGFQEEDKWYPSGFDNYGYEKETIAGNLMYISDRWVGNYRISWLIGLIDPHDELHREKWTKRGYNHIMGKGAYERLLEA